MIHQYKNNGYNIVMDVCSGAIHVVDDVTYDVIALYEEKSLEESKVQELIECQNYPKKIEEWIKNHLSLDLPIKLDQAIRARRKRFFNAEKQSTKKKSIDLEYGVWLRLSKYSRKMKMTLSETITYMIDERESKALYESQMTAMKAGLKNLLNK